MDAEFSVQSLKFGAGNDMVKGVFWKGSGGSVEASLEVVWEGLKRGQGLGKRLKYEPVRKKMVLNTRRSSRDGVEKTDAETYQK